MLRLTAKSTQFGHKTFTSWLIESAGTIPIKRRKDSLDGDIDNTESMNILLDVGHLPSCVTFSKTRPVGS
jgi:glycerol-3-phosphate O-acyltransferase / dihydroxyacetone phosphate acyltransferase